MTALPTIVSTPLTTVHGSFEFFCFAWGPHEEDNLLCQLRAPLGKQPFVRVQSACYTAEIFRSLDCDCHAQLDRSLSRIAQEGGLLIYMLCDGRGAGLLQKVRGLALGHAHGLDTHDAYVSLEIPTDAREYDRAAQVLRHFGISTIRLLTNNPRKVTGLECHGIEVERSPLEISSTAQSRPYLQTKATKMGHLLSEFAQTE